MVSYVQRHNNELRFEGRNSDLAKKTTISTDCRKLSTALTLWCQWTALSVGQVFWTVTPEKTSLVMNIYHTNRFNWVLTAKAFVLVLVNIEINQKKTTS